MTCKPYFKGRLIIGCCLAAGLFFSILPQGLYAQEEAPEDTVLSAPVSEKFTMAEGWGAGLNVNTFGPGISISKTINKQLALRIGGNYMKYKFDREFGFEDVNVHNDILIGKISILGDWYPFGGFEIFHITGGLLYNFTKGVFTTSSNTTYRVGSYEFTPSDIGNLKVTVTPNKFQPYLGIGLGRAVPENVVGFKFEIGTSYQGPPRVDMEANGLIEPTAEQEDIVNANIEGFILYPVLNLELTFRIK